jgi:hypothetical protein
LAGDKAGGQDSANRNVSSKDLVAGAFACLLDPIIREPRANGAPMAGTLKLGLTKERCALAAEAGNVPVNSLVADDASATKMIRGVLESRLSEEGASPVRSNHTLAFFDKGISAAKEARAAYEALFERPSHESTSKPYESSLSENSADILRADSRLADLYQFGRDLGATAELGIEAQTLAWVIGVDRFMWTKNVSTEQRAAVAEPFFRAILNVPEPAAPTAARAASTWNEYLAAVARAIGPSSTSRRGTPKAIGGGPAGTTEEANLREIAYISEERIKGLAQTLPVSSNLRMEADLTAIKLRKFVTPPPKEEQP